MNAREIDVGSIWRSASDGETLARDSLNCEAEGEQKNFCTSLPEFLKKACHGSTPPRLVGRAREIISCSRGDPPWIAVKHREVDVGEEGLSPGNASRMEDSLLKGPKDSALSESFTPDQQWWRWSSPPLGKPPTGFSESDVGEPSDIECDVGRRLDKLVSSELETTMLTDDEVRNDSCLTMESKRFQLCQN